MEIIDEASPIRAAFVERYGIEQLSSTWQNSCGFYILFSHLNPDNSFDAYVGKASNGFYNRLKSHDKDKDWWRTALLVFKDRDFGFSSTQSAYMEGLMRSILDSSPHVNVRNIAPTGDKTLPKWDEPAMEAVALSTLRIMFLRGYRNASMARIAEDLTRKINNTTQDGQTLPAALSMIQSPARTDDDLFQTLRTWRRGVADANGCPAFVIFPDKTLRNIISRRPNTIAELVSVSGVSMKKAEDYGEDILNILNTKN
ncbi:MAG: HRDC domain-containing protein [Enterococcus sp.]|nr:HRDC domain-containing protein [Enterococcus sp.]